MSNTCGWNPPPASAFQSEIVNINVGPLEHRRTFSLQKNLLRHFSTYFNNVFLPGSKWSESLSNTCTLDDEKDDQYVYDIVFRWMFTGQLGTVAKEGVAGGRPPKRPGTDDDEYEEERNGGKAEKLEVLSQSELCLVWLAAQKRWIPRLQNDAIDELHGAILREEHLSILDSSEPSMLHFIYDCAFQKSALRRLLVEAYVKVPGPLSPLNHETQNHWPKELLLEIVNRFDGLAVRAATSGGGRGRVKWQSEWRNINLCDYHEHARTAKELAGARELVETPSPISDDEPHVRDPFGKQPAALEVMEEPKLSKDEDVEGIPIEDEAAACEDPGDQVLDI